METIDNNLGPGWITRLKAFLPIILLMSSMQQSYEVVKAENQTNPPSDDDNRTYEWNYEITYSLIIL